MNYSVTASSEFARLDIKVRWSDGPDDAAVSLQPGQSHVFTHTYRSTGNYSVFVTASGPIAAGGSCSVFESFLGTLSVTQGSGGSGSGSSGTALGCGVSALIVAAPRLMSAPIARTAEDQKTCKSAADVKKWTNSSLRWNEFAADACITSAAAAGSALVPGNQIPGAIASASFGLLCGVAWKLSARFAIWANDPPDPNFRKVAQPVKVRLPKLRSSKPFSARSAAAFNALVANMANQASLTSALTHAFERAQGAERAGDATWQAKQREAASLYASALATSIRQRAPLARSARLALERSGLPNTIIPRGVVVRAKASIRDRGFPSTVRQALTSSGLGRSDQAALRSYVVKSQARATSFPGFLTRGSLSSSEASAANAFARLAASVSG